MATQFVSYRYHYTVPLRGGEYVDLEQGSLNEEDTIKAMIDGVQSRFSTKVIPNSITKTTKEIITLYGKCSL